jgi:hypothetical protein
MKLSEKQAILKEHNLFFTKKEWQKFYEKEKIADKRKYCDYCGCEIISKNIWTTKKNENKRNINTTIVHNCFLKRNLMNAFEKINKQI